jgi:hydroxyethylthiazole kinase-like uncharacterized protein yjeF
MQKLVTSAEMREMDRRTIEDIRIPGLVLMENAGLGVVRCVEEILCPPAGKRVGIFCGKGNNGGDAMVAARHLHNRGFDVKVILIGEKEKIRGDALVNFHILQNMKIPVFEIQTRRVLEKFKPIDLIVDGLLGTGITGEVAGLMVDVIRWINGSGMPVVSIDLPSGLGSDDGEYQGACVRADYTVTMAKLKRGLVLYPGREMAGRISIVDIGIPEMVSQSVGVQTFLVEEKDVRNQLPLRPPNGHKGTFGKIVVLAGSTGLTGAATLCSKASLLTGAGLTVLGIPEGINSILEEKLTEVMTRPLPQTSEGTLSLKAEKVIYQLLPWADVLAIGPGLSTQPETKELIRKIVGKIRIPHVIDADGLNAFEGESHFLEKPNGKRILTPHYGELARLISRPIDEIAKDPIESARENAKRFGSVLVLKGAPTVVADPQGNVYVNSTGNSGMATAGSGDVLTGTIAGFLAQGCLPVHAAVLGVYLHGLAGDIAGKRFGRRSLVAGDLLVTLGQAIQRVEECR